MRWSAGSHFGSLGRASGELFGFLGPPKWTIGPQRAPKVSSRSRPKRRPVLHLSRKPRWLVNWTLRGGPPGENLNYSPHKSEVFKGGVGSRKELKKQQINAFWSQMDPPWGSQMACFLEPSKHALFEIQTCTIDFRFFESSLFSAFSGRVRTPQNHRFTYIKRKVPKKTDAENNDQRESNLRHFGPKWTPPGGGKRTENAKQIRVDFWSGQTDAPRRASR